MNVILFDSVPSFIPADDFRYEHMVKVLHLGVGDVFQMGIVGGAKGEGTVLSLDEKGCTVSFCPLDENASALFPVTLLIGQVRPICMRRILREAVDLGVETMVLTTCDLTEKSYVDAKLYTTGEYQSILLDGAMQSGKTGISEVRFAKSVDEALTKVPSGAKKILLDNVIGKRSLSTLEKQEGRVVLAIGPERGFTDRERNVFQTAGYEPMLFGSRILRTETICSAGTAVLLSRLGLL